MLDSVDAAALKVPIVSVFELHYCLCHQRDQWTLPCSFLPDSSLADG
jgi:hypothetical protein